MTSRRYCARKALLLPLLVGLAACTASGELGQNRHHPFHRVKDQILLMESEIPVGDDFDLRWQLASASVTLVNNPATPDQERLRFAQRGLHHANKAVGLRPEHVEGYYYRAIALGMILKHSALPRLGRIEELEAAGVRARELGGGFHCAGPLRLLGLLYRKAPPWPIGPELAGEVEEIDEIYQEALGLVPRCPQVRQDYAEFLFEVGRLDDARTEAQQAEALLKEAPCEHLEPFEQTELKQRIQKLLEALWD